MMEQVKPGDRIRVTFLNDPYTALQVGTEGTVLFIDDNGTIHTRWDTGQTLGLIPGVDRWERL